MNLMKKIIFTPGVHGLTAGKDCNSLMRKIVEKAGLGPNVKSHSGRKIMIQALTFSYRDTLFSERNYFKSTASSFYIVSTFEFSIEGALGL